MSDRKTFEYGGYHFTPIRKFHKKEGDFFRHIETAGKLYLFLVSIKEKTPCRIFDLLFQSNRRKVFLQFQQRLQYLFASPR